MHFIFRIYFPYEHIYVITQHIYQNKNKKTTNIPPKSCFSWCSYVNCSILYKLKDASRNVQSPEFWNHQNRYKSSSIKLWLLFIKLFYLHWNLGFYSAGICLLKASEKFNIKEHFTAKHSKINEWDLLLWTEEWNKSINSSKKHHFLYEFWLFIFW